MAKILVVDDSATMLSGTTKILESANHDVIQATSGKEGIEKAISEQPQLILMDIVMPDLSGFQATRAITTDEKTKHIPVVMLSTKDQETDMLWATRQGASDYVVKPPNDKELLATVDKHLK